MSKDNPLDIVFSFDESFNDACELGDLIKHLYNLIPPERQELADEIKERIDNKLLDLIKEK